MPDIDKEIEKIVNEDLKGIATDEDIQFVVQNYIDYQKSSLIDNPSILVSFIALSVAFFAIISQKGINSYAVVYFAILVVVLAFLLPIAMSQYRREVKGLLSQYVELRKTASKKAEKNLTEKPED